MTGKEFVDKTSRGSKATDQLRKEVDAFLKTIAGIFNKVNPLFLLPDSFLSSSMNTKCFEVYMRLEPHSSYEVVWLIVAEKSCKTEGNIKINWSIEAYPESIPCSEVILPYATDDPEMVSYPARYIRVIHENLPAFAEKLLEKFPFLENNLRPLLDNADYLDKLESDKTQRDDETPNEDKKSQALMQIVKMIEDRYRQNIGKMGLGFDDGIMNLFDLARKIEHTENDQQLESVATEIDDFNK